MAALVLLLISMIICILLFFLQRDTLRRVTERGEHYAAS